MYLKVQVSYSRDEALARRGAWEQWHTNIFESAMLTDLRLPGQFEAAAEFVSPEDIDGHVRVSSDPGEHVEWLLELGGLGFERLYIHNVNLEQEAFIQDYGKHVLPALVK